MEVPDFFILQYKVDLAILLQLAKLIEKIFFSSLITIPVNMGFPTMLVMWWVIFLTSLKVCNMKSFTGE